MFNKKYISVHTPEISKDDLFSVYNAIKSKEISGQSKTVKIFEKEFAKWQGTKYAVSVTSGTAALFLAVKVLNLKQNDEVLISSNTNIATALAAYHNNLKIIPIDSNLDTWNLDESIIEEKITKRTKAIIPVHFLGNPVNMKLIKKISNKYNLKIIEDCAESHGAKFFKKKLGTFGDMGCYSFYSNKVITTGEGGMVVTNNKKYYEELQSLKNLYFGKLRFFHKKPGYNFRMGGLQAALGISQLKRIKHILKRKRMIFENYKKFLANVKGIKLQKILKNTESAYWMIGIYIDPNLYGKKKSVLQEILKRNLIETRDFFFPLNKQPFLTNKKITQTCKNSKLLWDNSLYLPSSNDLKIKEIKLICEIIKKNCENI